MKVLVAERIAVEGVNYLEDSGHDVDVMLDMTEEELIAAIPPYHALIVRSNTPVTAAVIEAGVNLRIIGRAGISSDNIDMDAATAHGILVCNAPRSNSISVAEHTIALMLAVARRLPAANESMHEGKWERETFTGTELYRKTLAIVGLGRVGELVAQRATALGMHLVGYDPYCSKQRAEHLGVTLMDDLTDMCRISDFITVHPAHTPKTIGLFGPAEFAAMKDGVYLINTARGGIFDEKSMADYIRWGKVAGAAIDVYESEPCLDSIFKDNPQVILTPHIGASTVEAQNRAGVQIAEYVALGLDGKMVPTSLNIFHIPPSVADEVGPYIAACQMAGSVIAQLAQEGISSLDVTVRGNLASYDVHALSTAALRALLSYSSDDPVNFINADTIAKERGINVTISVDPEGGDYVNVITFKALSTARPIELSVTLSGTGARPRIVSIFGYDLDLIPGNNVMILEYDDKPGKMGIIGTILGKRNINIRNMELGSSDNGTGTALVLMNVDQEIPQDVRQEIEDAAQTRAAWYLKLYGM